MVAVVLVVVNCIIMSNTVMNPMKHALLSVVEFPSPRHSKQMLAILPKSVAVRYMNDKTEIFDGLRGQLGDSGRARPWPRAFSDHCFNCDHIVVHFCKFRGSKSTQHTPGAVHVRGSHASIDDWGRMVAMIWVDCDDWERILSSASIPKQFRNRVLL